MITTEAMITTEMFQNDLSFIIFPSAEHSKLVGLKATKLTGFANV